VVSRLHVIGVIAAAAAIALSAEALHAALPTDSDTSGRTSYAGQLLIAASSLQGSPFENTVVLVAQHSRDGALGIIINRPLGERPIAALIEAFGADATDINGSVRVYRGGPVSPEIGFVVHSAEYHLVDTIEIDGKVALTAAPDVLRDIGHDKGPSKKLVAFGYAGWGPAQLDNEIDRGDWYNVTEDPTLVFDDDRAKVWVDAMARRKTDH
jgi:putative transcriptional regulator